MEVKQLTRATIEEYRAKLDHLKNVGLLEVAQEIKEARSFGDISENAEYDAAMDKQAHMQYEIEQLESLLANVIEIDEEAIDTKTVAVGTKVKLKELKSGMIENYHLVASSVADPFTNKISNESPVGKTLLGHGVGDIVDVQAPVGNMQFEVLEITK